MLRGIPHLRVCQQQQFARAFSNSAPNRAKEYFVMIRNKTNADSQLSALVPDLSKGSQLTFAGAMLDAVPSASQPNTIIGSCFACVADSSEEVLKAVEGHPFNGKGIWDLSTAKVWPLETVLTSDLPLSKKASQRILPERLPSLEFPTRRQ